MKTCIFVLYCLLLAPSALVSAESVIPASGYPRPALQQVHADAAAMAREGFARSQMRIAYVNDDQSPKVYLMVYDADGEPFVVKNKTKVKVSDLRNAMPVVIRYLI